MLLEDCLFSSEPDPRTALKRMADAGAVAATYKSFAYEILGTADRSAWPENWDQASFPPPEDLPPRSGAPGA